MNSPGNWSWISYVEALKGLEKQGNHVKSSCSIILSIIFPYVFPICFLSFCMIFPSFSHHFPIIFPSFSHHFPIIFPYVSWWNPWNPTIFPPVFSGRRHRFVQHGAARLRLKRCLADGAATAAEPKGHGAPRQIRGGSWALEAPRCRVGFWKITIFNGENPLLMAIFNSVGCLKMIPSGNLLQFAIENGHWHSELSH